MVLSPPAWLTVRSLLGLHGNKETALVLLSILVLGPLTDHIPLFPTLLLNLGSIIGCENQRLGLPGCHRRLCGSGNKETAEVWGRM
jgi:hypothetical protein